MTLPEDDEETFEDFVEWLYSGKFEISPHPPNGIFTAALKLFVLADKYRVFELKNIITKQIFILGKNMQKPPSLTELSYAYEHTVQHSGIRKLLTDWQTWNIDLIWFERPDVQAFLRQHPDCATDLCVGLAKKFKKTMIHEAYDPFLADMPEAYKDKDKEQEKMSTPQPIGGAFARNGRCVTSWSPNGMSTKVNITHRPG